MPLESGRSTKLPSNSLPGLPSDLTWTADGTGLFVAAQSTLRLSNLKGNATKLLENPCTQFLNNPVPSRDGRHLTFLAQPWDTNVWRVEGF